MKVRISFKLMEVIMKKFILGFLTCLLLSTTVVYGASIIKASYFNDTLKLAINGSQADVKFVTVELEGEQYGRNYVSVADFVKALNDKAGLNATVDFDSKTKTILVESKVESAAVAPVKKEVVNVSEDAGFPNEIVIINCFGDRLETYEKGGITVTRLDGDVEYVDGADIVRSADNEYVFGRDTMTREVYLAKRDTGERVLENIPITRLQSSCVTYEYYLNTILPLIDKGAI